MEAPVAGPIDSPAPAPRAAPSNSSVRATPSNFLEVMSQRAEAEANAPDQGGAGWNSPPQRQQQPQEARLADFQDDQPPDEQPPQQDDQEPQEELEQLYDENGDPIDMKAYAEQRAQVMTAMQQALDTGKLPWELLKQMSIEVEVNGEKREVTLEEARGGYMRRAHHTRELEKAYGMQQDAQNMLQLERMRNEEWKDPRQLRAGLRMLGLESSFMKAAFEWASERVAYMKKPESERQLIDRMQQYELEREQMMVMQRQNQQLMQRQQQQTPDQVTMHVQKQIEQLMPRMFKQHKIGMYPLAQQTWLDQLKILCQDGNVTAERANEAALATRELLSDLDRIRQEQTQVSQGATGQPPRWLAPRRLSPGRPQQPMTMGNVIQTSQNAGKPGGRRPSDFAKLMGLG